MRIICLVENTAAFRDIVAEHGLSLYIETERHKILFDMGQTGLFARNAETVGLDLSKVDIAVLSHGHYDHGGGLAEFFEINEKAPVYMSRYAFGEYCNGMEKYIGLDKSLLKNKRIVYTDDEYEIDKGLCLYSCNKNKRLNSFGAFGLTEKTECGFIPDSFIHEQYFMIEEKGKRVLISGCSHKGITDIVRWFNPDILIGGFHFSKMPLDIELEAAAKLLDSYDTEYYTCHCTGKEQYEYMKKYMKRLNYFSAGEIMNI
jgi:7,8-dihydropterin-6-yl-methyl-4-(beta-D-ribofuranosyl)aminobenzene 5'-phosphate synthase